MDRHTRKLLRQAEREKREKQRSDPAHREMRTEQNYWRVTISTLGVLTTTDLGTSPP